VSANWQTPVSKTRLRRIQYAAGADDLKQSFSLTLEYRVRRRKRKDCRVFLMLNQIKVLDFGETGKDETPKIGSGWYSTL